MKVQFFTGMVIGIIMTAMLVITLPLYWGSDRKNIEMNLGKQQGRSIVITIIWNPEMQDEWKSFGTVFQSQGNLNKVMDESRWNEHFSAAYKDKEEAIRVRNGLLKVMEKQCISQ